MNREIKFRGKRTDNGEWVYGYLFVRDTTFYIQGNHFSLSVIPESVGEYTGLKDKNGKEIYEGEVVDVGIILESSKTNDEPAQKNTVHRKAEVIWDYDSWKVCTMYLQKLSWFENDCEIIGNIYENPELLK